MPSWLQEARTSIVPGLRAVTSVHPSGPGETQPGPELDQNGVNRTRTTARPGREACTANRSERSASRRIKPPVKLIASRTAKTRQCAPRQTKVSQGGRAMRRPASVLPHRSKGVSASATNRTPLARSQA